MILRRLADAIRTQNWFTVIVEILIVVIGIFLGLQVQQWSEEQDRSARETIYTMRLHSEVIDLGTARATVLQPRERSYANMSTAATVLFSDVDRPLTEDECRGIAFNYFVSNPTADLGSLLELQSSGRLSAIRNEKMLKALQSFLLARARSSDSQAQIANMIKALGPEYPNLIQVISPTVVEKNNVIVEGKFQCDLAGMRSDPAFKQDFEIAYSHYGFHMNDNARVSKSLNELHRVLDELLNITHEKETP